MRPFWIYLALLAATLLAYAEVRSFDFVNYDDPFYVSANPHVRAGLTAEGIKWAFTSGEGANWFPLTRLSELIDHDLFGMDSGAEHMVNVLIHAGAAMLLFAFLLEATGGLWPSALVALLFALHPLHVESVAWISERKDVMCAFFWMLSLWAYVRGWRWVSLGAFALGLMSKPMIVTLPVLLLLIDVWPLSRKKPLRERLVEKAPFFALTVASGVVTYLVQQAGGAVRTFSSVPLGMRVENALVSYVVYAWQMIWPAGLAVFYPYPAEIPAWEALLAALVLIGVSVLVWRGPRHLMVGWFWYLVTLAPVIGLVQVGGQARADRYMYVPMVGLAIMLAWSLTGRATAIAAVAAGLACAVLTWQQAAYWRNSETLFQHAVDVTKDNAVAEHNLGTALTGEPGRLADAIRHLQQAVRINPQSAPSHTDLGTAYAKADRLDDAIAEYRAALRIDPDLATPHNNLGATLSRIPGKSAEAESEFQAALRINPDDAEARNNLNKTKQSETADKADAEYNQGLALAKTPGRMSEAIAHFEAALRINPNHAEAHNNLGFALTNYPNRIGEAIRHFQEALRINPDYADAHYNLGVALSNLPGRMPEAIHEFEAAERLKPDPELEQLLQRLKAARR